MKMPMSEKYLIKASDFLPKDGLKTISGMK
jgi:hypothetical protein